MQFTGRTSRYGVTPCAQTRCKRLNGLSFVVTLVAMLGCSRGTSPPVDTPCPKARFDNVSADWVICDQDGVVVTAEADWNGKLSLWDSKTHKVRILQERSNTLVVAGSLSPDCRWFATHADHIIQLWDLNT